MEKNIPTLYEWAGGNDALEKLTQLFYTKVAADDLLSEVFKNMSSHHSRHVAHFMAEVFGGEKLYTEKDKGSHATMEGQSLAPVYEFISKWGIRYLKKNGIDYLKDQHLYK